MDIDQMSVLERRRIEAMVLGPVVRTFAQEIGEQRAREIARKAIVEIAQQQGRALAQRMGANDLETFARSKEPWTRNGALEIQVLEQNRRRYSFNVTRCRYAEMYKELGMPELGSILSCGRDWALSQGFSPRIKLRGTQTIMEGAPFCDFRYTLDEEPAPDAGPSQGKAS